MGESSNHNQCAERWSRQRASATTAADRWHSTWYICRDLTSLIPPLIDRCLPMAVSRCSTREQDIWCSKSPCQTKTFLFLDQRKAQHRRCWNFNRHAVRRCHLHRKSEQDVQHRIIPLFKGSRHRSSWFVTQYPEIWWVQNSCCYSVVSYFWTGIFVLLGSNGAGKSTTLSVLAGLTGRTSGSVRFSTEDGAGTDSPPRGTLGIVPQKNVLFPELTCHQTLKVWVSAVYQYFVYWHLVHN